MTTAATAAYTYRATDAIPLYALRRKKAQEQHCIRTKSTYGHCIKDEVLIDEPNSRNQRYKRKQLDR